MIPTLQKNRCIVRFGCFLIAFAIILISNSSKADEEGAIDALCWLKAEASVDWVCKQKVPQTKIPIVGKILRYVKTAQTLGCNSWAKPVAKVLVHEGCVATVTIIKGQFTLELKAKDPADFVAAYNVLKDSYTDIKWVEVNDGTKNK